MGGLPRLLDDAWFRSERQKEHDFFRSKTFKKYKTYGFFHTTRFFPLKKTREMLPGKPYGQTGFFTCSDQVGQCNDAYGAVVIATKLAEALQCAWEKMMAWYLHWRWSFPFLIGGCKHVLFANFGMIQNVNEDCSNGSNPPTSTVFYPEFVQALSNMVSSHLVAWSSKQGFPARI